MSIEDVKELLGEAAEEAVRELHEEDEVTELYFR